MTDLMPGLDMVRARRALNELAEAAAEALAFFERENYDAAQIEVDRCRRAVRTLDEIRREQKRRTA